MKRLIGAGLAAGVLVGFLSAARDVSAPGWGIWIAQPLRCTLEATRLIALYTAGGAVVGVVLGLALAVVSPLLARRQDADGRALLAGGLVMLVTVLLLLEASRDAQPARAAQGFAFLALITLGAWLIILAALREATPARVLAAVMGIAAGTKAFFLLASSFHTTGQSLQVRLGMGVLVLALSVAAGFAVRALWAAATGALARRWSEKGAVYALVGILGIGLLGGAGLESVLRASARRPAPAGARRAAALAAGEHPNVILISIDTLRPDVLSCQGGRARTWTVDDIARQSFVFERAYSVAPWTRPSFAAFFSGRYPSEMGVSRSHGSEAIRVLGGDPIMGGAGDFPYAWRTDREQFPQAFERNGYATSAVVTNTNLTAEAHADEGWTSFYHMVYGDLPKRTITSEMVDAGTFILGQLARERLVARYEDAERANPVANQAETAIWQLKTRPVLFWVHFLDPHYPYDAPTSPPKLQLHVDKRAIWVGWRGKTAAARERFFQAYVGEVEYCDKMLTRVMATLKASGLWDTSIVVFWSDHGEEFWEHEDWGHGQSLYNELLHVPLMIHLPGQTEARRVTAPVSLLDVMPTLLDLCHLPAPADLRGRSLAPTLRGQANKLAPLKVYLEGPVRGPTLAGLMLDHEKLIYNVAEDEFSLYDLATDPGERHDIHGTPRAPDTRALERELRAWSDAALAMVDRYQRTSSVQLPPEMRRRLRDMGYAQ